MTGLAIASRFLGHAIGSFGLCLFTLVAAAGDAGHVIEASREIPIAHDVDIVVVGGSSGAVECACQAARQGASVFLLAPRPYLGTDICSTLRLWLDERERPKSKLAVACFGEERAATPFSVKAAMDRALLEAGVSYLTGCYATDVLCDKDGRIAGVVMANRSGRQAVRAKVVVDATERAVVARSAGVKFRSFEPGAQTFRRVVIGGQMRTGDRMSGEKKDFTCVSVAKGTKHRLPVYEYTLRIDLEDDGFRSFQRAENRARDMTYDAGSESASETLYHVPSDTIIGEGHLGSWPGADEAMLEAFRPKGTARLYVLNAYADLDGAATAKLLRPLELMAMGRRIGRAAAAEAAELPALQEECLPAVDADGGIAVTVGEDLEGIRSRQSGAVRAGRRPLPVLGRYDVIVVGGGTSGAPAGIAAAKSGAKTLVVEYLYELGGVGTVGLIGAYWRGLRRGFTAYVDEQVNSREGAWNAVEKAEWLRRELIGSGAEVWLGTLGCGALVDDGQVRGVVVATPWGRGAVLADVVIDATGNSDIAACAGAQTQYGISDRGSLNVQIAGFPDRPMKNSYVNTCYTMVDDTDVVDVWHLMTWKRVASPKEKGAFDVGQLVDSRERRRIVGDYILTTNDILNHRTFPDTISQHYSNFDAAAFPDADLLLLADAKGPNFHTDLPYRCLLPKDLNGILVVGLGCSSDRDAMTLIRMQPDLQNQGYAAGLAAAAAAKSGGHTRDIDIKAIQQRLITEDVLDQRVYTDRDSYPMSPEVIEEAAWTIGNAEARQIELLAALAVILAHPDQAIPMLKSRHDSASTEKTKLAYAKILGILGDPAGAPTLIAAVDAHDRWDKGVPLTSERKTGNTFSDLDRLVIALGFSRAPAAPQALLRKLEQLRPSDNLSHYKAISLAFRHFHCPEAAGRLAKLLRQPGFTGHATVEPVVKRKGGNEREFATVRERLLTQGGSLNRAFKELIVVAMLYQCGDRDGMAKAILESYTNDIHGHFARYAQQTLDGQIFGSPP
ncbi:MAG: FAD-dependent oxidoreductase [Planctomycetes bacterium]|nr:FAD-dependent oxidoreductase [Planctomycetota bacterium]MBL7043804.1 FAD-dependent oxidoreductase [Pirellulaceae bacterium]